LSASTSKLASPSAVQRAFPCRDGKDPVKIQDAFPREWLEPPRGKVFGNFGKAGREMAQRKQDFFGNVIGKITELPGAKGLIDSIQGLGDRLDEIQKRVRGLERMEKRVADLEKRVKALEGGSKTTGARPAAKKATSTKASGASTTRRRTPPKKPTP
jgi:hypothetical protein